MEILSGGDTHNVNGDGCALSFHGSACVRE